MAMAAIIATPGCLKPTEGYLGPVEGEPGDPCTPSGDATTELGEVATALEPGQWGELRTMGFAEAQLFTTAGWVGHHTNAGVWDPTTRQAYVVGERFFVYDEMTNAWSDHPEPCDPCGQGSDHTTFDAGSSRVFRRVFGSRLIYELTEGGWQQLPEIPTDFSLCCAAVEYFPGRDELVYADHSGVFVYSFADGAWSQPWGDVGLGDRVLIEYSPVADRMLVLSQETGVVVTLDAELGLETVTSSPLDLMATPVIITPDLVTGDFIFLAEPDSMYTFDAIEDVWERHDDAPPPFESARAPDVADVLGVPVSTHCSTLFPTYNLDASTVWVYRHGA